MSLEQILRETNRNADKFASDYSDLLACMNPQKLSETIEGFLSTELDGSTSATYENFAHWIVTAIENGLLVPEFKLTELAHENLEELRAKFGPNANASTETDSASVPASDPFEQVVHDYKTMSSREFKNAWMQLPERRQIYEAACEQGLI